MSFKSVEWVMHMTPTKGRPGDKFVLVTLAWHKNEQTGKCCPSIPLLMSETGMSRDFIRDALKRLTAAGLIKVSRTPGGRTDYLLVEGSNDYRVPTTTGEQLLPGEGSNGYRGRGVTATPNMEVIKELNKEGETPLPPPSPAAKREAQTHLFSLAEIPDASKEKTRTHQAFKPPELGVELTESAFRDWMTVRKAKHSPLTETAWKHFKAQVLRSELSIQQAVELCATKGWISINAEWQAVKDYQAEFDSRSSNDRKVDFVIKALGLTDNRKETEK